MDMQQNDSTEGYDLDYRMRYVDFSDLDLPRVARLKPIGERNVSSMLDQLYAHLMKFPETKSFFQSENHIPNLKKAQSRFFVDMLCGNYDKNYLKRRLSVGRTHERIGLEPQWYIGAYSQYINFMMPYIFEEFATKEEALEHMQTLVRLIFVDMGFAIDTYIEEMNKRENRMKQQFIESLSSFSKSLNNSVSDIASATTQQSATVNEQASAVQEVTATVAEVKQTSIQATEHAKSVISYASNAVETSKEGTNAVELSIEGMHGIQKQVETIADKILSLSEQTQQIGEIIQSVNEIAEQSKLLALNAAIEAARAGEHGRGFSVVASEIRSLADQSKQATNQVRGILGEIQKATNSAVIATEEGGKKVEAGVVLANKAGENIHKLTKAIADSADSGKTIASSSKQQAVGMEQIVSAMQQISNASQNTLQSVKQTELVAQNLKALTIVIEELLKDYTQEKIKEIEWKLA